jgi:hypothetical protein
LNTSENGKDLSRHILTTSAQLVGVCLTVISLIKIMPAGHVSTLLNKFLAIDVLLFTASTLLSYASMRNIKSSHLEKMADQFFMIGLLELSACAVLLAFELI